MSYMICLGLANAKYSNIYPANKIALRFKLHRSE
jgi:hypothetical protein